MKPMHYAKRLEEISKFEDGWFELNDGEKFDPRDLKRAKNFIDVLVKDHSIPIPFIYALPDNELSLEWDVPNWMISVDLNFKKNKVMVHCYNVLTSEVVAYEKPMMQSEAVFMVVSTLGKYFFN